jgi:hypothetical protein
MGHKQNRTTKTNSVFLIICALAMHACTAQESSIHIPDPYLKAAIEDKLWVWDPTPTDMLELTSLNLSSRKIENLKGLEYAKNLHTLRLTHNQISDLSPLSKLSNLRKLIPNNNQITSLSPLAGLGQLRHLDMHENKITDLTPLSGLSHLEYLNLHENRVRKLSGLSNLTNLQHLDLNLNEIADLSPLSDLRKLAYLNLSHNQIKDISALSGLTGHMRLYLYDNQISDISPLSGLNNLEVLSLPNNQISNISALSGLTHLPELFLHYNQISDISALSGLTNLTKLWLHKNPLDQQACATDIPQIIANNPDMMEFRYDACSTQYDLTISSGSGGSISSPGEGPFSYAPGTSVPITARAHAAYCFVEWTGSAVDAGSLADPFDSDTTLLVNGDYSLRAHFVEDHLDHPAVSTYEAEDRTERSARLRARLVDDGGELCTGWFRYWEKDSPVQTKLSTSMQHSLQQSQEYTRQINGLQPGTTYCFQAMVEHATCQDEGNVREFSTLEDERPPVRRIHVDDNAFNDPGPGDLAISDTQEDGTEDHPYDSIQEAIRQAQNHDTILVHAGSYYETLNLMGKNLAISRYSRAASGISSYPVIDAQSRGTVVTFNQGEDSACLLSGLVLTGGRHTNGGAIACIGASPTIKNCLIVGNRSVGPAGAIIYCKHSRSLFGNLTVSGNSSAASGSAFRFTDCDVTITNSILWGNAPSEIALASGNDPSVVYSDVQGTWPGRGNIAVDPLFALPSYGAAWTPEDYHLLSETGRWDPRSLSWVADELSSPCIDAGDPMGVWIDEPSPHGARINMGAYGGTNQASYSLRSVPVVARWTFDETSGDAAYDSAGDNHGAVYGATWAEGLMDGALQFDGIDDYVDCGNGPALAPDLFTISMWIYAQASSGSRSILRRSGGDKDKDYEFKLFGARNPTFSFGDGSQSVALYSSSALPLNEWTHIALTRDETEAAIQVNGVQVVSNTYDFAPSATHHKLIIGGGSLQPFQGKIDDLQIHDSVLSPEEIAGLAAEIDL